MKIDREGQFCTCNEHYGKDCYGFCSYKTDYSPVFNSSTGKWEIIENGVVKSIDK